VREPAQPRHQRVVDAVAGDGEEADVAAGGIDGRGRAPSLADVGRSGGGREVDDGDPRLSVE
jgi:hypothetical protein